MGSGNVSIEELLESRHATVLEWGEPQRACGPEGNPLAAHVSLRATVHDCINLQREVDRRYGCPTTGDDARRLEEFMVVNWAWVVEQPRQRTEEAT